MHEPYKRTYEMNVVTPKESLRVLISTGHLGTAPSGVESFLAGMDSHPDYVVADGGSADPGPVYLGADIELGHFVRDELELFVTECRKRGIPLIIGSAGDTGSNRGVDHFVELIQEIATEHNLPKFKIGYFYSEVPAELIKGKIAKGERVVGLGGFPDLTAEEVDQAARIVAVAGVHPFIKLLEMSADVIVAGRCGDINFTAAPCIHAGFPDALAYHMGKMIECASLVAEPFMGKETNHRHDQPDRHQDHALPSRPAGHHRIGGRPFDVTSGPRRISSMRSAASSTCVNASTNSSMHVPAASPVRPGTRRPNCA